jgi:transcriptional regulator with XRE-family HTH domain
VKTAREQTRAPAPTGHGREDGVDLVSGVLGARIRHERTSAGLSVRGLAGRTGVSPSLISQIERGLARPSVATLFSIATELGLPIADLFADPRQDQPEPAPRSRVQRRESRKHMTLAQGVRWERLTFAPDHEVDFVHLEYPPGASSSPDGELRAHGGREFGYVLSGRLTVRVGEEEHVLRPNDSISFDSTIPHELVAGEEGPMRAIWFVVNRRDDPRLQPLR